MAERFDLDAIEADDALLDLLAAGGESAWEAGQHDPALMLLADLRLAVEVEDELPVETIDDPESFLARCAALNPVTDPFARKMAARGFALGVAAVAALSVSGVAAAVNGNPLAPYESVIEKVVDGLRPETSSYPKDEIGGLPALDKSKIVKVGKDFQKKQQAKQVEEDQKRTDPFGIGIGLDTENNGIAMPPLARPKPPQVDRPTTTKVDTPPTPVERKSDEEKPTEPIVEPTQEPTSEPTDTPTTPTETPTTPTDEPSQPTEPTEPTTTPPPNGEGSNGSTGDPSVTPIPSSDTGDSGQTDDGKPTGDGTGDTTTETGNGATETGTGSTDSADSTGADENGAADSGAGSADSKPVELPSLPVVDEPAEPAEVKPVLPTPTGEPILPNRLEQYVGKALAANAKHSSGKPSLGYANGKYAKGKHSTGAYAEGKHAAFDRAHGSMAPVTLRQILGVLNTPMTGN